MGRFGAQRRILSLSLVVAALVAPVAALAAPAAPPPTTTPTPNPTAPPKVEIYGFSPAQPDDPYPDPNESYDWSVLTTLAWRSDARAVDAAHRHGARVDLDARQGAAQVVFNGTVADAARWVTDVVSQVLSKGLDGVNFDLEQPIDGRRDPKLASAYTGLVAATAAAVKAATFGAARVTVDVPYLPYDTDGRDYDYLGLAAAADALFVMAYDMQALVWTRCVASPNSPLPLIERSVRAWLGTGVPAEKLILGLPWYGYTYECVDDDDDENGGGDRRGLCRVAPVPYAGAPCSDAGGQQLGYAQIMEREFAFSCLFELSPVFFFFFCSPALAPTPKKKKKKQSSTRRRRKTSPLSASTRCPPLYTSTTATHPKRVPCGSCGSTTPPLCCQRCASPHETACAALGFGTSTCWRMVLLRGRRRRRGSASRRARCGPRCARRCGIGGGGKRRKDKRRRRC
jgi:di-N-acetylchitobiase